MTASWMDINKPPSPATAVTAAQVANGPIFPPQQRLLTYSPDEWEGFVEEWAYYCLTTKYEHVLRFSGAGDMGIDVAGFVGDERLLGVWDNFQCKHYGNAIRPSDVWVEFGKIIWYSYKGEYTVPRRYYFVSPRGAGTSLSRLFSNDTKLREELLANWDKHVKNAITSTQEVLLDAKLRAYVDSFDFTIFDAKTALQLVDDHRATPVHTARFGGGLPTRPASEKPPQEVAATESRYVTQLFGAYSEHTGTIVTDPSALPLPKLKDHFRRQREAFYEVSHCASSHVIVSRQARSKLCWMTFMMALLIHMTGTMLTATKRSALSPRLPATCKLRQTPSSFVLTPRIETESATNL
ncbi:Uncharacterised protein [Klebsiella pneumoniae]|nr:Uncharacterised protein [Klebsiella pneumoniae]SWU34363.1 Uncharacterised protein [Klebsiella pneumoniae]